VAFLMIFMDVSQLSPSLLFLYLFDVNSDDDNNALEIEIFELNYTSTASQFVKLSFSMP